ncbi:uncharacterized protein LAESUDRAFT_613417, partial [Laetiporus sulphureus 93-53]
EENWSAGAKNLQYIKSCLHYSGKCATEKCWNDDEDDSYERLRLERPISHILTTRSIRETPKRGSQLAVKALPRSQQNILKFSGIRPVASRDIQDEQPVDLAEVLSRWPGHGSEDSETSFKRPSGISSVKELHSLLRPVEFKDEEDEEPYKQHMVVVDGWQAFRIPSSPLTAGTPSLGDSSSDVDELFLASPTSDEPFVQSLMSAKMEEYELSRSQKIGNAQSKPPMLGEGQSLSTFLSPLISRSAAGKTEPNVVTTPKSRPSSAHRTVSSSMLGQPPSTLEDGDAAVTGDRRWTFNVFSDDPSCDLEATMEKLCGIPFDEDDLHGVILREKLDEKETMLMDVPVLRPPNEHPPSNGVFLPSRLQELLAPPKPPTAMPGEQADVEDARPNSGSGFLRKVKGLQLLNIELSWRPFKYGPTIPTDEEVTEVAENISCALVKGLHVDERTLTEIMHKADEAPISETDFKKDPSFCPSLRKCWSDECLTDKFGKLSTGFDDDHTIINQRRIIVLDVSRQNEELHSSDSENNQGYHVDDISEHAVHPPKRIRLEATYNEYVYSSADPVDGLMIEDSGIFIDLSHALDDEKRMFTNLASEAEGFEGPDIDGDLFADVDPIHQLCCDPSPPVSRPQWLKGPHNAQDPRLSCLECHLDPLDTLLSRHEDANAPDGLIANDSPPTDAVHSPIDHQQANCAPRPLHSFNPSTSFTTEQDHMSLSSLDLGHLSAETSVDLFQLPLAAPRCSPTTLRKPATPPTSNQPSPMSFAKQSMTIFLGLKGKRPTESTLKVGSPARSEPASVKPTTTDTECRSANTQDPPSHCNSIPEELLDARTLCLSDVTSPGSVHRYLASIDLIHKRVLVRYLTSAQCAIDLIERESLGGVHLILDAETAVLFSSLASLPSQLEDLTRTLSELSWRFMRVLVLFEGFPSSHAYREIKGTPGVMLYPFPPFIIKAVKKMRRYLNIADAYQSKCSGSVISCAFASSVEEAALLVRRFGDQAQSRTPLGNVLWGSREWLDLDEQDGEPDLAQVDGMNSFAASIILSQVSLDEFLGMTVQERLDAFGALVGFERIERFNTELDRRAQA